jgi:DNA polymerase III delta prime subunit
MFGFITSTVLRPNNINSKMTVVMKIRKERISIFLIYLLEAILFLQYLSQQWLRVMWIKEIVLKIYSLEMLVSKRDKFSRKLEEIWAVLHYSQEWICNQMLRLIFRLINSQNKFYWMTRFLRKMRFTRFLLLRGQRTTETKYRLKRWILILKSKKEMLSLNLLTLLTTLWLLSNSKKMPKSLFHYSHS